MDRLLLRPTEAAESLGISRSGIYELISKRRVPVVRIGRSVRIPADALIAWVNDQLEPSTDALGEGESLLDQPTSKARSAPTIGEAIATAILEKARRGDEGAFVAIADRLEGNPKQQIDLNGAVDLNIELSITRVMEIGGSDALTLGKCFARAAIAVCHCCRKILEYWGGWN